MRVSELDYQLPLELIAQRPLADRDASRMLLLDRREGRWEDRRFAEFPELLRGDELLVFNNARVLPARLFGRRVGVHAQRPSRKTVREHLTGTVEVFLVRQLTEDLWEALVRPGRKMQVGERVIFGRGELEGEILSRGELGLRTVRFRPGNELSIAANIDTLGHVPLPPYINRPDEESDRERYQTVFARCPGSVAAPTAGLHFTPEILRLIQERGCESCEVTLDVGLGTFQPVHTEILEDHKIHAESYDIDEQAAEKICRAKREKRSVLAVGTTVVRALEDAAARAAIVGSSQALRAGRGEAQLFIVPGHTFRIVDVLLTNFHLPKSTLLALVAAFAGKNNVLAAYRHAVEARYRFYSYGDCMLIR
ncbi:MAG TPA: tRNA preQ1(34) S-adenosylmethionine ribosyltransferase-isomerase QueA [Candidatus Sulfotelmatobacter sp.]|nr:tRNA preQ1(34) S-adenosylmethionine ribosyltransferase-isomerase QueA [Candidatus Sulfotelmatobacter sp.]